jgi:hypothetical protein
MEMLGDIIDIKGGNDGVDEEVKDEINIKKYIVKIKK